jgi:hypothetical protein
MHLWWSLRSPAEFLPESFDELGRGVQGFELGLCEVFGQHGCHPPDDGAALVAKGLQSGLGHREQDPPAVLRVRGAHDQAPVLVFATSGTDAPDKEITDLVGVGVGNAVPALPAALAGVR